MNVWLTLADAADIANRSERTMRNWVRDGVLAPRAHGRFHRDDVLHAEQQMRRGRPAAIETQTICLYGEHWAEVTPCGKHRKALDAGLVAIGCRRCTIDHVVAPPVDQTTKHEIESQDHA